MRSVVQQDWRRYNGPIEGVVAHMYQDVLGLVTVGMGNLIDPRGGALPLPFRHNTSGRWATEDEIRDEWIRIKSDRSLATQGHRAAAKVATMHLADEDIDQLWAWKLQSNDRILAKAFPDWDTYPADAQFQMHSMAWAMGPYFYQGFPTFTPRVKARNWLGAVEHAEFGGRAVSTSQRYHQPRNRDGRKYLTAAAMVEDLGLDREVRWGDMTVHVAGDEDTSLWMIQRMLQLVGEYPMGIKWLDADFGPQSKAAFKRWSKGRALTKKTVTELAKASGLLFTVS